MKKKDKIKLKKKLDIKPDLPKKIEEENYLDEFTEIGSPRKFRIQY